MKKMREAPPPPLTHMRALPCMTHHTGQVVEACITAHDEDGPVDGHAGDTVVPDRGSTFMA